MILNDTGSCDALRTPQQHTDRQPHICVLANAVECLYLHICDCEWWASCSGTTHCNCNSIQTWMSQQIQNSMQVHVLRLTFHVRLMGFCPTSYLYWCKLPTPHNERKILLLSFSDVINFMLWFLWIPEEQRFQVKLIAICQKHESDESRM